MRCVRETWGGFLETVCGVVVTGGADGPAKDNCRTTTGQLRTAAQDCAMVCVSTIVQDRILPPVYIFDISSGGCAPEAPLQNAARSEESGHE
ncbi:protein of unknown function [Paraburkholderia kururiensis]